MYKYTYLIIPLGSTTVPFNDNPNDNITCIHTRVNIGAKKRKPTNVNWNSEHPDITGFLPFSPDVEPNFGVTSFSFVNYGGANNHIPTPEENNVQVAAAEVDESISCCGLSCFSSMLRFLRKKLSKRRNYKGLEKQDTVRDSMTESTNSASSNLSDTPRQTCDGFLIADAENRSCNMTVEVVAQVERSQSCGVVHADVTKNDVQDIGFMFGAGKSDGRLSHQCVLMDNDEANVNRLNRNQILQSRPTDDYSNPSNWFSCNAIDTIQQPSSSDAAQNKVCASSQNREQNRKAKRSSKGKNKAKRHKGELPTVNQKPIDELVVTKLLPPEIVANRNLYKYWYKRYRLFSKFDQGIKLDAESWYSVTPEKISRHLADRCRSDLIVDGFCGAGGNTIQFAFTCERVIAIDIDPQKVELAKHNASIYNVADRIEFIVGDFFEIAPTLKADVVFLSPPWGGPSYSQSKSFPLSRILEPYGGKHLYEVARQISEHVAYYLPRNVEKTDVVRLARRGEKVEIEENLMSSKLVAVTAYFGELVYEEEAEEISDCS